MSIWITSGTKNIWIWASESLLAPRTTCLNHFWHSCAPEEPLQPRIRVTFRTYSFFWHKQHLQRSIWITFDRRSISITASTMQKEHLNNLEKLFFSLLHSKKSPSSCCLFSILLVRDFWSNSIIPIYEKSTKSTSPVSILQNIYLL